MEIALVIANLVAGVGCAIPLSKLLGGAGRERFSVFRCFAILLSIYLVESIAVAIGMGIPVFSVGLAFMWGIVFGMWLRNHMSPPDVLKTSLLLSLYSSLPAASFLLVPVGMWISGRAILSVEEGIRFGIPEFPHVLWPLTTILGFYATLVVGAVVLKVSITLCEVQWLICSRRTPIAGSP